MYKVFLADDEIVIREGIRNGFPWEGSQFVLCGEAPDGEIALPMIQELKPDILLTDIRMPFMDGLGLSRQVSRTMPWVHIIILSGYDEFSYAREAITLGVKEYMLKPVSAQKLEEVLTHIAGKIQKERAQQADLDALRRQLASFAASEREQLLRHLLEGADAGALFPLARKLYMNLEAPMYLVMLLEGASGGRPGGQSASQPAGHPAGHNAPQSALQQLALRGVIQRLTDGAGGRAYQTVIADIPALLVLGENKADIEERAYALAQGLAHEAVLNKIEAPVVAIGAPVTRPGELPQALASAQMVLHSMRGQPRRIAGSMDADAAMPSELMEGGVLPLYEKLRYASQQESGQVVEEYFASMGDLTTRSLLVMHYMLVDMLLAATRVIKQHGGDPARILPASLQRQEELLNLAKNPQDALNAGKRIVSIALTFRDQNAFSRYGEILRKACAYIEENCHRPEMTLHNVASHVALSNNHFCTVFSQEMGQTFIEHLTQLRMEKAKSLLLASDMRSSDVALEVGYNDAHYFSYLFRKNTGMSPREFRREAAAYSNRKPST